MAGFLGSAILIAILVFVITELSGDVLGKAVLEMSKRLQIMLVGWGICAFLGLVGSIAAISNQIIGGNMSTRQIRTLFLLNIMLAMSMLIVTIVVKMHRAAP